MKSLKLETYIFVIFVLSIVISANAYFTWDAYGSSLLKYIIKCFRYFGLLVMTLYVITYSNKKLGRVPEKEFILGVILFLTLFEMNFLGASYQRFFNIVSLVAFVTFIICMSLNFAQRSRLYEIFMKVFALITLPSVIYFCVHHLLGINLPYSVLGTDHTGKAALGVYYELRPLGLIISSINYFAVPRLCGIFDEPGVIGTISAMLVAVNICCHKFRNWTFLLVIEGIMSFSLAFFAMMIILASIIAIQKSIIKFLVFLTFLVFFSGLFISVEFDNPNLKKIQNRIDFTSDILIKDNRTTDSFKREFESFINRGGYSLFFGEGIGAYHANPNMTGSNSYKCLIYDYGIVGFILYMSFFILLYVLEYGINKLSFPFFVVFMASLYQRAYVLNSIFLFLYICSLACIAYSKNDMINLNKKSINGSGEKFACD